MSLTFWSAINMSTNELNCIAMNWIEFLKHLMQNFSFDVVKHSMLPAIDLFCVFVCLAKQYFEDKRASANTSTTIRYCQLSIIAFESIHAILLIQMDWAQFGIKRWMNFCFDLLRKWCILFSHAYFWNYIICVRIEA